MLSDPERILLRRLAVFSGGWTLEAAEGICSDRFISSENVFDLLVQLAEKSLVLVELTPQGGRRYRFLETTRQCLQERLEESGELEAVRIRHLEYYLAQAIEAYPAMVKYRPVGLLDRIEADHDNYRIALDRSLDADVDFVHCYRIATTMGKFWDQRGYLEEGRERLTKVLSRAGAQSPTLERVELLLQIAWLAKLQSDHKACDPYLQESLQILQQHYPNGLHLEAEVYNIYAVIGIDTGDYQTGRRYAEEALRLSRQTDDPAIIAWSEQSLGWILLRLGDYDQARIHLEEALRLRRAHSRGVYATLQALGELAFRQGDIDLAQRYLLESLTITREGQNRWETGAVLGLLGWVELTKGDLPQAKNLFLESLEARRGIGDKGGMAWCLEKLAQCVQNEGCPEQAVVLFGCAEGLRLSINELIDPDFRADYEQCVIALREQLGFDLFLTTWEQGKSMVYEEIVKRTLCQDESL